MNHSSVIRVASVPHGHVYVQHLADPDRDDGVIRLPDPPPENPAVGAPWWPLVMLDAHWITDHADEFDLYHLHFGFDSVAPEELAHITQTLRNLGKPFVYTVHDLRNPHHLDRAAHDAALDVLVPAADALITLTQGAAQEISSRWDREAAVIPHPHVVDLPTMRRERPHRERATVGIHLKSLRASIDPLPVLAALLAELQERDFELVVDVHTDVVTPGEYNHDPDVTAFDYEDALARIAPVRAPAVVCGRVRYLREALDGTGHTPADLWDLSDDHPARVVPAHGQLEEGEPRLLWTLNIGLTVDDWYRAGGFDEEYVGYGAEDTDFGQRIAAAGGSMWWSARATAFHQYHPVSEPPVEHAASIARNANLFRSRWGFDPMEGWIRELEQLGHLAWDEPHGWTHRT